MTLIIASITFTVGFAWGFLFSHRIGFSRGSDWCIKEIEAAEERARAQMRSLALKRFMSAKKEE